MRFLSFEPGSNELKQKLENQHDLQPKSKAAGRSISRELNSFQIFKGPLISSSRRGTKGKTWLATARSKVMI